MKILLNQLSSQFVFEHVHLKERISKIHTAYHQCWYYCTVLGKARSVCLRRQRNGPSFFHSRLAEDNFANRRRAAAEGGGGGGSENSQSFHGGRGNVFLLSRTTPIVGRRRRRKRRRREGRQGRKLAEEASATDGRTLHFLPIPCMHSLRLTCAPLDDDVAGLDVVDDEFLRLGNRHHGVAEEAPARRRPTSQGRIRA